MSPTINDQVKKDARVLWEYHRLDLGLRPSDFVLALGSHDERVAEHAARLILDEYAPVLVTSGGYGKVTASIWSQPEGERYAEIAIRCGVPSSRILIEDTATNTGDNITKSRELLERRGASMTSGILVTKPYMRRRAYATAAKQWPSVNWLVSSPEMSFDSYPDVEVPEVRMIELMVGDLQRIKIYAEQGFQIPQNIPDEVWACYERLVRAGFSRFLIK